MATRLTARDAALLLFLAKRRAASMSQMQRRFFPSYRTTARRMSALTAAGYITARPLVIAPKVWQSVFVLSQTGRRTVSTLFDIPLKEIPEATVNLKTHHTLAVSE